MFDYYYNSLINNLTKRIQSIQAAVQLINSGVSSNILERKNENEGLSKEILSLKKPTKQQQNSIVAHLWNTICLR